VGTSDNYLNYQNNERFMKTIAIIMLILLCGLSSGYQEGDYVAIVVRTGLIMEAAYGNITEINDNFICLNCTKLMKTTTAKSSEWKEENVSLPQEFCIGVKQIAMMKRG
jgi:Tfp pilus assembly protein PilP